MARAQAAAPTSDAKADEIAARTRPAREEEAPPPREASSDFSSEAAPEAFVFSRSSTIPRRMAEMTRPRDATSASTSGPTHRSALSPFGQSAMPVPAFASRAVARSNTRASTPTRRRATHAARPPMPPPTMIAVRGRGNGGGGGEASPDDVSSEDATTTLPIGGRPRDARGPRARAAARAARARRKKTTRASEDRSAGPEDAPRGVRTRETSRSPDAGSPRRFSRRRRSSSHHLRASSRRLPCASSSSSMK